MSWPGSTTLRHSVYDQSDSNSVHTQYDRTIKELDEKLPNVADHHDGAARGDLLPFTGSPKRIWRKISRTAATPPTPPANPQRRSHLPGTGPTAAPSLDNWTATQP
ncbi:hypothetical protein ERC79_06025 [Rhodococcus sp. ABRD24]|nr:hypothetical protein ERC79_06025 [Rhodococcus sp. ABRD24]